MFMHAATFARLIIFLFITVHAATATENEQMPAALTLPHPRLWQKFQRLAAALSTNEVCNIGALSSCNNLYRVFSCFLLERSAGVR